MNSRSGGGGGQSPYRSSPASSKKALDWISLEKHPLFSKRTHKAIDAAAGTAPSSSDGLQNLLAWDVSSSRLFLWDADSKCVHRLSLRFRDPDTVSSSESSSSVIVEAAFPAEILLTDIVIQTTVHHISLNTDGSTLLLCASDGLSVMYLSESSRTTGDKISCRTALLGSRLFSCHNNGLKILQASWHPYSSVHLGVLSSDSVLRLFDLSSDLERAEQEFYLQPENGGIQNTLSFRPTAFSFGVHHLWERFSVFLLYSNGSLYIICPVVPFGSICNFAHIEEIYKDAHICGLDSSKPRVSRNSGLAIAWLEATFPLLVGCEKKGDDIIILRAHSYTPPNASVALQGPLINASFGDNDVDLSNTHFEGKAVNLIYNSIGKDSIFIISWSSGLLQINALADEIQPGWKTGSSPRLCVEASGNIESVSMICESVKEEVSINYRVQLEHELKDIRGVSPPVPYNHLPLLLKLAIVDLSLPKDASNNCLVSLFPDPLVSERFYCLHNGGMDIVILHHLPFSNTISEMEVAIPSVRPIFMTSHLESSASVLCGYVIVTDSHGHSQFVGVMPTYECIVLEMKDWNDEFLPCNFNLDVKLADSTETIIPGALSKELLRGPKAIIIPPSTSLRSLTPDSIEGRSTLREYVNLFHENYVEYAHKVYSELRRHGEHVKTIVDIQLKRLKEVEEFFSKIENNEKGVEDRIARAFKVYELLDERLKNFIALPAANIKPLSKAEREFNVELDRTANLELDSLSSSIDALNIRLKRYLQGSPIGVSNKARAGHGRRKDYVSRDLALKLKSSLSLLSDLNSENTKKVKLIEDRLISMQK